MRRFLLLLFMLLPAGASLPLAASVACTAVVPNPVQVRTNGRAELLGDYVLVCEGTTAGTVNLTVAINTALTSRAQTSTASEALLIVNEPGSSGSSGPGPSAPQVICDLTSMLARNCPAGTNIYQGARSGPGTVTFNEIPLPSPGVEIGPSHYAIVFRVVNLRADIAPVIPDSTYGIPVIYASMSASNPEWLISNSLQPVAFGFQGLFPTARTPNAVAALPPSGVAVDGCAPLNRQLALNPASASAPDGPSFIVRLGEGYAAAFKQQASFSSTPPDVNSRPQPAAQNIPAMILPGVETGFFNPAFPTTGGLNRAGLADRASRFQVKFAGPAYGIQVHAPVYERGRGPLDSRVRLVAASGSGYTPLGPLSSLNTYYDPSHTYVYEITAKGNINPTMVENIDLPFYLAYTGDSYVPSGVTTVRVNLAPISADTSAFAPDIPRFADTSGVIPVATVSPCSGRPVLTAAISNHAGTLGSTRTWTIKLANTGTRTAVAAQLTGVTIAKSAGPPACNPQVITPLPLAFGDILAGGSSQRTLTLAFPGCSASSTFKVTLGYGAGAWSWSSSLVQLQ